MQFIMNNLELDDRKFLKFCEALVQGGNHRFNHISLN